MHSARRFSLLSIVLISLTMAVHAAELTPDKVWLHDFALAQKNARETNRPLIVHFHMQGCPPCRRMEKETLNSPEMLQMIDRGFVAVKVDINQNPQIGQRYNIHTLPSDVMLSPEGQVIGQPTSGLQDKQRYLALVSRIEASHLAAFPKTEIAGNDSRRDAPRSRETSATNSHPPSMLPSDMLSDVVRKPVVEQPEQRGAASGSSRLALDGYCPVTLLMTRRWKPGSTAYSAEYDGMLFRFQDAQQLKTFRADPARFAPRLLGCDPVVLAEQDIATLGSVRYAAYYDGELYLFENADSRIRFRTDPSRYVRMRHVLKPGDISSERR